MNNEIKDLIRGACGGFLFGIPLIYTMEVWWIGSLVKPEKIIVALAIDFLVVFLLNRTAGFRTTQNVGVIDAAMDSIEAIAIGIVCTTLMLILLREIDGEGSLNETVGKIMFESMPFTLGVALANQVLSGDRYFQNEEQQQKTSVRSKIKGELHATISDIGATLIGAMVVAFNIAPTDEVAMLAAAVTSPWLLAIMAFSLVISYGIVFDSGFANQQKRMEQKGIFQHPLSETVVTYFIAVLTAIFMLWFFQRLSFDDPWTVWLTHGLILGLPATIGGAAGRLAI
ncbi:TIGR02587 family membrane protein [Calothrix sp. 336/3]|uniref:TIGR02587 family membrane protein n=1 Tax=Calothrix sp. 336/3 TaxID=1337936 RepID=UPI0004E296F3|nr:TIGR02587 family membrane protein [Calothrix sp. 336/3]AKG20519.1 integral membrane protein [Calothrix sp. 336/3]